MHLLFFILLGFFPILWSYIPPASIWQNVLLGALFLLIWLVIANFSKKQRVRESQAQFLAHLPALLALFLVILDLLTGFQIFSTQVEAFLERALDPMTYFVLSALSVLGIKVGGFFASIVGLILMNLAFLIGRRIH